MLSYPAGVPTSLVNSSQQWDFPNGWPPLNHMLIEGLRRTGHPLLEDTAFHLADKWLANNYLLYKETTQMFEKVMQTLPFSKIIKSLRSFTV